MHPPGVEVPVDRTFVGCNEGVSPTLGGNPTKITALTYGLFCFAGLLHSAFFDAGSLALPSPFFFLCPTLALLVQSKARMRREPAFCWSSYSRRTGSCTYSMHRNSVLYGVFFLPALPRPQISQRKVLRVGRRIAAHFALSNLLAVD